MSICFFAVPQAANQAAQNKLPVGKKPIRVKPLQKSNVRVHFPATRHDVAMQRRLIAYNIKNSRESQGGDSI